MANATTSVSLTYTNPSNEIANAATTIASEYQAQQVGEIDVPDTTPASTSFPVAFGSIASATSLRVENRTGQEVGVRLGGRSASGALVSGTVTLALALVPGERLSVVAGAANGGTPGTDLAVRRSGGNVVVTSYDATGVKTADVSTVTVYQDVPIRLGNGGAVLVAMPDAVSGTPLAGAEVTTTDVQAGAGKIATFVFGQ